MKKLIIIFLLSSIVISASGCAKSQVKTLEKLGTPLMTTEKPVTIQYQPQDKLSDKYTPEQAEKNGDIVNVRGKVANQEKLLKFIENYQNKKTIIGDMVRLTNYTTEGDAIITDLIIDSNGMKLIEDTTRDKFSNAQDRKRTESRVSDIVKTEKPEGITYTAKIDKGEERYLAYTSSK